jgi:hypothetical protein
MDEKKPRTRLEYGNLKQMIDFSYPSKKKEEEAWLGTHWESFNKNVNKLENMAREKFSDLLKCIDLNGAEILDFRVRYLPGSKNFDFKITKWKSSEGTVMDDSLKKPTNPYICPHSALAPILGFMGASPDILVIKFQENYGVKTIREPDNYCDHMKEQNGK